MKIAIVEVEKTEFKNVKFVILKVDGFNFERERIEFEVTDYIIEVINYQGVFGWIDGVDGFGKPVKRTYMLVGG